MASRISWADFPDLQDHDRFAFLETAGTPGEINITLLADARITWWKSLKFVRISNNQVLEDAQTQDANHGPQSIRITSGDYSEHKFTIAKAKMWGAHTDMYDIFELSEKDGRNISLTWQTDSANNWLDAIGSFVSDVENAVVDAVTTVVNAIVTAVESVVEVVTDFLSMFVRVLFAIPVVGRVIAMIVSFAGWLGGTLFNAGLDLAFGVLGLIGVRPPEKILRLVIIVQRDESGAVVAQPADIQAQLDIMIKLYKERANIKVIPVKPFQFNTSFSSHGPLDANSFTVIEPRPSQLDTLVVNCKEAAFADNLLTVGSLFELKMNNIFWGNTRDIIGYGAPIYAFAVKDFVGNWAGCSLWATTNYVTVKFSGRGTSVRALAHECGHACNLAHTSSPSSSLMSNVPPYALPPTLEDGEIILMRLSHHCSYF